MVVAFFLLFFPNLHSLFFLKNLFLCKKNLSLLCIRLTMKLWIGFGGKQIIDSLSFLFLLTHIGLNFHLKMYLNNRANHENLDSSYFFFKNYTHQFEKKKFEKLFHILLLHPV